MRARGNARFPGKAGLRGWQEVRIRRALRKRFPPFSCRCVYIYICIYIYRPKRSSRFSPSFPPIRFPRHVHRASRESSGDNINPGSFRQASPCQPFVSLANCLLAVLAKWRLRAETRDCERVIKNRRENLHFLSLSVFHPLSPSPPSLSLFFAAAVILPWKKEVTEGAPFHPSPPCRLVLPQLYCFWDLQRAMVDSSV